MADLDSRILDGTLWHEFCDRLKEVGDVLTRDAVPENVYDRAIGIRYLTRLLRAGLESQLEFGDPRFPGFYQLANETIKIGNDNPDNFYQNSTVSGRYDYKITGTRGTVPYISFGSKAGGYGSSGALEPTGQIDLDDIQIRPDGTFELIASAKEQAANWLPMTADTSMIIVRQTFHDRRQEEPARLQIECLNPDGENVLDPAHLERTLFGAVQFMRGTANVFVDWMEDYSRHINELPSDDQEKCQRAGGDSNIHYLQSYWELADDEALVIHAKKIPKCWSWNFQLSDFWMESLDYRYYDISVNKHTAEYEEDGSCKIVVAHKNPGPRYKNWLYTAGHNRGGMLFRWIQAEEHPPVDTQVVKFSAL